MSSYTIKIASGSLSLGDPIIETLNVLKSVNLNYCETGVLHTDILGAVTTKLIDTEDFKSSSITTDKLAANSVTSEKLADSILLNGIPTAITAAVGTNTTQLATTSFVATACLNISGSSAETITAVKTFNVLPIFTPLNSVGIVHNNASGELSTTLIQTSDIADSAVTTAKINDKAITFNKLASDLILPIDTILEHPGFTGVDPKNYKIVNRGYLAGEIKPFTDTLDNNQPINPIIFYHVNNGNTLPDASGNHVFELSSFIRHIIDDTISIFLPAIRKEGLFYSVINKSSESIIISTASSSELIYNCFVAPDGDDNFNLDKNQCLEFISIMSNGVSSWQAHYY